MLSSSAKKRLGISLLVLRLGVAIVMIPWALDKIIRPDHAAQVFSHFYSIADADTMVLLGIGVVQLIIIAAFLAGIMKAWSYGAVLVMHGISTLSSWQQYADGNLLFFAAWPMLAACIALFLMRDEDQLLVLGKN